MENKTAEELWDFYKHNLSLSYERAGYGESPYLRDIMVKENFIKAMQEYTSQERLKGIKEGFEAAREERDWSDTSAGDLINKYPTLNDYINRNKL